MRHGVRPTGATGRRAAGLAPLVLALLALGTPVLGPVLGPAAAQSLPQQAGAMAVQAALPRLTTAFRQALAAAAAEDPAIAAFYRDRDYAAFWTADDAAPRRAALLAALHAAPLHALPASAYDATGLADAFAGARSEGDRGRLEVRMTRALLRYAHDLGHGVLVPGAVDKGIVREIVRPDPQAQLAAFAAAPDPAAWLGTLVPRHPEYARLVRARLVLIEAIRAGGWGATVPGGALKPGDSGAAVIALRDRLGRLGYLPRSASPAYDGALQAAVQAFQFDHGLTTDGVAGEATLAEINIGPEDRLGAVTVALERERWLNIDRGARHIWVNLADFSTKLIDDGKVTFQTRAVVGSTIVDKRTPEFSHAMTYLEINPDWTVPPGIIRRDYLPRLQANPNALGHLQLVDGRGRVVPRGAVNFAAYSARNFPFNLRQPPGPSNALGRVKFMFPNPWSIYLHDTPDKHLFARESRTYSSGCVRLNDPFDLAYALLARQSDDPRRLFHSVLDSGRQERLYFDQPVPVHLVYRTAFTAPRGAVQYRRDIYGRDAAILAALRRAGVDPMVLPG
jgi:murein L,D-transpeptidase YcbB/YkuD